MLPPEFFRGQENPFENKRVGHIPDSVNLPIEDFLTDDDRGVFRSASELRAVVERERVYPKSERRSSIVKLASE